MCVLLGNNKPYLQYTIPRYIRVSVKAGLWTGLDCGLDYGLDQLHLFLEVSYYYRTFAYSRLSGA